MATRPYTYIKNSGTWINTKEIYIKESGAWRSLKEVWWKNDSGVWVKVFVKVVAGSQAYDSAGTFNFVVPYFNTLNVKLWGAGASGGAIRSDYNFAGNGGDSSFAGIMTARGGKGGRGLNGNDSTFGSAVEGTGGDGGTATSGSTNITGGNGGTGDAVPSNVQGGNGGNSPNGGSGGSGDSGSGNSGNAPGGGGAGGYREVVRSVQTGGSPENPQFQNITFRYAAGGGGAGAYSERNFTPAEINPGSTVTVIVGSGATAQTGTVAGGAGAAGRCRISWT
jgi:hypothetical protein